MFFKKMLVAVLMLPLFCACMRGQQTMSMEEFYEYPVGMTTEEFEAKAGKPFDAKELGAGEVEYEYIEQITVGNRFSETRHYYFVFKDNKLNAKRVENMTRLPRIPNSYDMQTSENEIIDPPEEQIFVE